MSNLNKLVQPECGAPNPLVSAARQISSVPRAKFAPRQHNPINFAKEFVQHRPPPVVEQGSLQHQPSTSATATVHHNPQHQQHSQHQQHHLHQQHPLHQNHPLHQQHPLHQPQYQYQHQHPSQHQPSAGDQLEEKYRNDLLSEESKEKNANDLLAEESKEMNSDVQLAEGSKEKVDDVEFWQSLSQAYIGPEAGTLEPVDVMDYAFDERNPLKDSFENPFEEGLRRLEQGDIPSAALLFEAAVQMEPENTLAWRYLGTTQAQNEMDKSAIKALRNCLRLDSNDQAARLAIAVSLVNENQHREACTHLLEWLMRHEQYGKSIDANREAFNELDAELSEDPFMLNQFSLTDKHQKYVRERFVEAARMSPNNPDPEVQDALGVLFNMRGDYARAVDCFRAALSVRQQDSLLWNRLGATLANGNKSEEAVIAYRRALEISPGFLRSRYNLAISLIHLNLYDEAAKQLIQILNMQAAGKGSAERPIRTRSITSSSIWNTLRTVATLMNKPDLYPTIDGRDLRRCNELIMRQAGGGSPGE